MRLSSISYRSNDSVRAGKAQDHAVFRRNRLNTENMIDSESLERDLYEKPVFTFSHRALARFPLERNRSSDKESRQVKKLEPVMTGKPLRTFP
ncbi:hypothetical protein B1812_11475 [Methylocystis bryophila]|uniref:Uncharacterized protein n=2 Tax=Methylocystis bryophila TaxID=655015 RepID=A0A1W6MVQ4_9HYPH|nr:hypothetical protein B1812_11475 [Methylocystis bryophila]